MCSMKVSTIQFERQNVKASLNCVIMALNVDQGYIASTPTVRKNSPTGKVCIHSSASFGTRAHLKVYEVYMCGCIMLYNNYIH